MFLNWKKILLLLLLLLLSSLLLLLLLLLSRSIKLWNLHWEVWEREEEAVCGKSNGDGTGNVHSPSLVFTTTGGMADECVKYHSRLAELNANKKGESYSWPISWIRELKYLSPSYVLRYYAWEAQVPEEYS